MLTVKHCSGGHEFKRGYSESKLCHWGSLLLRDSSSSHSELMRLISCFRSIFASPTHCPVCMGHLRTTWCAPIVNSSRIYLTPPHCPMRSASVLRALPVWWPSYGRQAPWGCAAAPEPAGGRAMLGTGTMVELMSWAAAAGMSNSSLSGMCSTSSSNVSGMITAAGCQRITCSPTCQSRAPTEPADW